MGLCFIGAGSVTISSAGAGVGVGIVFSGFLLALVKIVWAENQNREFKSFIWSQFQFVILLIEKIKKWQLCQNNNKCWLSFNNKIYFISSFFFKLNSEVFTFSHILLVLVSSTVVMSYCIYIYEYYIYSKRYNVYASSVKIIKYFGNIGFIIREKNSIYRLLIFIWSLNIIFLLIVMNIVLFQWCQKDILIYIITLINILFWITLFIIFYYAKQQHNMIFKAISETLLKIFYTSILIKIAFFILQNFIIVQLLTEFKSNCVFAQTGSGVLSWNETLYVASFEEIVNSFTYETCKNDAQDLNLLFEYFTGKARVLILWYTAWYYCANVQSVFEPLLLPPWTEKSLTLFCLRSLTIRDMEAIVKVGIQQFPCVTHNHWIPPFLAIFSFNPPYAFWMAECPSLQLAPYGATLWLVGFFVLHYIFIGTVGGNEGSDDFD